MVCMAYAMSVYSALKTIIEKPVSHTYQMDYVDANNAVWLKRNHTKDVKVYDARSTSSPCPCPWQAPSQPLSSSPREHQSPLSLPSQPPRALPSQPRLC